MQVAKRRTERKTNKKTDARQKITSTSEIMTVIELTEDEYELHSGKLLREYQCCVVLCEPTIPRVTDIVLSDTSTHTHTQSNDLSN